MRYYDEEDTADEEEDEMNGYTVVDEHSIFNMLFTEEEAPTEATPIPQNEQTVILASPNVIGIKDGARLKLEFSGENCFVFCGKRKIGELKPAYVNKLKTERAGQSAEVFYKQDTPPMIRIVFGSGEPIPSV